MFSLNASSIVSVCATLSDAFSSNVGTFSSILTFSSVLSFLVGSALIFSTTASMKASMVSSVLMLSSVFISSVRTDSFVGSLESRMLSRSLRVALNSSS